MSLWWCAKHDKLKDQHVGSDKGPCPLWWVPTTWIEKLQCMIGLCERPGTCLECDGWTEVKQRYAQRLTTYST